MNRAYFVASILGASFLAAQAARADAPSWHDVSVSDYRDHLKELSRLTAACAKARDLKTCDPDLVGEDDQIPLNTAPDALGTGLEEHRVIGYGWLRVLFVRAQKPDEAPRETVSFGAQGEKGGSAALKPRTTTELLRDAQERLARDLAQATGTTSPEPNHAREQAVMQQVLAGKEFRKLDKAQQGETTWERMARWLDKIFSGFGKLQTHARWIGWVLTYGFLAAIGIGLIVALLRLERRWRVRLVPESDGPAPGAASARDWQLWLADARAAAGAGRWREAIHFLYWAAISRLESKRLWPADRARTPREYLALVAGDDPRRTGLTSLTGDFERFWYGGRPAGEGDYRRAEEIALELTGSGAREAAR